MFRGNPKAFMEDVSAYKATYRWTIDPVGQLVEVDSRVASTPIVGRFCSGFNISKTGLFLTAGHCLTEGNVCSATPLYDTDKYRVSFNYQDGEQYEELYPIQSVLDAGPCTITWSDTRSIDYAVLQLDPSASAKWKYLVPVLNFPCIGSPVIAVSHPDGEPKKISLGQTQAIERDIINHTAAVNPGSSGSPLSKCVRGVPSAVGVNIQVSVDDKQEPDHKNHYAVSIGAIAKQSPIVKGVSYLLCRNGCFHHANTLPAMSPKPDMKASLLPAYGKRGS